MPWGGGVDPSRLPTLPPTPRGLPYLLPPPLGELALEFYAVQVLHIRCGVLLLRLCACSLLAFIGWQDAVWDAIWRTLRES